MAISLAAIAVLCILSAFTLGFSIVLSFFLFMWCGCCHVSDDDLDGDGVRRNRDDREVVLHGGPQEPMVEPERKGIPLNSKPPRLTPEQELMRDKALEKYKRRKARAERRRARQAAREARIANCREGDYDVEMGDARESDGDDGRSSVTSHTTLTSAASTVRTASTAAYGRGAYLLPPPHLCGRDVDDDDDDGGSEVRSVHSRSSRHSTGTTKSKASQGTVATIKSYMRHRQRQRLRRREEQQQIDLFNQWTEAQMASSSELSPSSKSSEVSSADANNGVGGAGSARGRRQAAATRGSQGRRATPPSALDNSLNNTHNRALNGGRDGGFDYWPAPTQQPQRRRSSSVASSAPRPPEEVLGEDRTRYSFLVDSAGGCYDAHREQEHLQAGYPASPNTFHAPTDFTLPAAATTTTATTVVLGGEDAEEGRAAVSHTLTPTNASMHVDPQQPQQPQLVSPTTAGPRRPKRRWKDVEHNAALSGFFNSPANNSFGGLDTHYDDGEAPAPFRGSPEEPSHSPLGRPQKPKE